MLHVQQMKKIWCFGPFVQYFPKNYVSLLDLIFTISNRFSVEFSPNTIFTSDLNHSPLLICFSEFICPPAFNISHSFYNFQKLTINKLLNWYPPMISNLTSLLLYQLSYQCFPRRSSCSHTPLCSSCNFCQIKFSLWTKESFRMKNIAHAKFKSTFCFVDYCVFSLTLIVML